MEKIEVSSPGKILKEKLDANKMSQKEFALRMDLSEKHVSKLINGEVPLSTDVAFRISYVIPSTPSFWINLEKEYREGLYRQKFELDLEKETTDANLFPYEAMANLGMVDNSSKIERRVNNLKKFFGVNSLSSLFNESEINLTNRKLDKNSKDDVILAVLYRYSYLKSLDLETSKLSLTKLKRQIDKIKPLSMKRPYEFLPRLEEILAKCGVAFITLPYIDESSYRVCFKKNNKIVFGLTLKERESDEYWFSFFEGIGHIILNRLDKEFGMEDYNFARNCIISSEEYKKAIELKDFTSRSILSTAFRSKLDPSLVLGIFQKDGYIPLDSNLNVLKMVYHSPRNFIEEIEQWKKNNC